MNYCVSDVHGCSKTLEALLKRLELTKDDIVYFLGDYIDRGPRSKEVLDILMDNENFVCLRGNHEDMLLRVLKGEFGAYNLWMRNGGRETLRSFGGHSISKEYIEFIKNMKLLVELDDFYLCHAGISFDDPLGTPRDVLLWTRGQFLPDLINGKQVISGHTPTKLKEIQSMTKEPKVIIDNGCVYDAEDYGNLVALRLDDMKLFVQRRLG
jgi:serine/threonine protein phosphatase 1